MFLRRASSAPQGLNFGSWFEIFGCTPKNSKTWGTTVFSLVFAVALVGFELATFELLIVSVQLSHALTAWNIMQRNGYIKMSVSG